MRPDNDDSNDEDSDTEDGSGGVREPQHHGVAPRADDKTFDKALMYLIVGGVFGFHHLYLKRTNQAIVYACTGGFFIVGLIYDMFHLDGYISDANFDKAFVEQYKQRKDQRGVSLGRCSVELTFGLIVGYAAYYMLPYDWHDSAKAGFAEHLLVRTNAIVVSPLATAFGVWVAGGIGKQRLDLTSAICGALFTAPIIIYVGSVNGLFYTALFADFWANYRGRYERSLKKQLDNQDLPYRRHVATYLTFVPLFYVVCLTALFNNATVRNDAGSVPMRDFVWNAVRTPDFDYVMMHLKEAVHSGDTKAVISVIVNGGSSIVDSVIFSQILGLDVSTTSLTNIHHICAQLSNDEVALEKMKLQDRWSKVIAACQTLGSRSTIKSNPDSAQPSMESGHTRKAVPEPANTQNIYKGEKFMKFEI